MTVQAEVAQPTATAVVVQMTEAMAREYLLANTGNRNIREPHVQQLARDMVEGRWRLSTDAVGFDTHGRLVNGQHRLTALIRAAEVQPDITIPLMVIRGLSTEVFRVLDQGRLRPAATVLSLDGIPSPTVVAAVAKNVLMYDGYPDLLWSSSLAPSRVQVIDFARQHRDEMAAARPYAPRPRFPLRITSYTTLRYLIARDSEQDPAVLDEFDRGIVTGENLAPGDPRLIMRNGNINSTWGNNGSQPRLGAFIKAWNCFVRGERMQAMRFRRDELPMPRCE